MKRMLISLMVVAATTLGAVAMVPAGAATPYSSAGITLSNTSPAAGGTTTATAKGYQPGDVVKFSLDSTQVGTATADANGVAVDTITIPVGSAVGSQHSVTASGVDVTGAPLVQSAKLTVSGGSSTAPTVAAGTTGTTPASTHALPTTGAAHVTGMLATGAAAVVVGLLIVMAVRRRRLQNA